MKDGLTFDLSDYHFVSQLASQYGASFYILDAARFRANYRALRDAFEQHYPHVGIGYSYKTNYTPHLCRIIQQEGGFAEVVSDMEYTAAKRLNIPGDRIIFNGPYKGADAFREAAHTGAMINLDNWHDVELLRQVSREAPEREILIGLRVNFPLGESASRFGFDVEGSEFSAARDVISEMPNVHLKGLHCHFPDRDLESYATRARNMRVLMREVFPDAPPEYLNIGGGFMSNMPEALRAQLGKDAVCFEDYGRVIGKVFSDAFKDMDKWPRLVIEPGTALVADCQVFVTEVLSTKVIRGQGFANVAGSIFDISPNARSRHLPVTPILTPDAMRSGAMPINMVAGFTCIENDILSEGVEAPLIAGDFLIYGNVGSYSVVMRPPFIRPSPPVLMIEEEHIIPRLIKRAQTYDDVFAGFEGV